MPTLTLARHPGSTETRRYETCSDDTLVEFVRAGDEQAFSALVARHRPWLVRSCTRWLGDTHEAQDVTQDVLVKTHRAISGNQEIRLRGWMSVVARRSCVDVLRKRRTDLPGRLPEHSTAGFESHSSDPHLDGAWNALSPRHREVLYYRELIGLPYEEISERMESSHSAIETLLHRARAALRREYERLANEPTTWGAITVGLASLRELRRRVIDFTSGNAHGISHFLHGSGVVAASLAVAVTMSIQSPQNPPPEQPQPTTEHTQRTTAVTPDTADHPSQDQRESPLTNGPLHSLLPAPDLETTVGTHKLQQALQEEVDIRKILDVQQMMMAPLELPTSPPTVPEVGEVDPLAEVENGVEQVTGTLEQAVPVAGGAVDTVLP